MSANAAKAVVLLFAATLTLALLCHSGVDAQTICRDRGSVIVCLAGGSRSSEGRVEIRANGTWGTICATNFSTYDAQVICRVLGYGGIVNAIQSNVFGAGEYPPLFTLGCTGPEESIQNCLISNSSCLVATRAGVKCYDDFSPVPTASPTTQPLSSIELIIVCVLSVVIVVYVVIASVGFIMGKCMLKQRSSRNQHSSQIQIRGNEYFLQMEEATPAESDTSHMATTPVVTPDISHESALKRLCYMPFDVDTITVSPHKGGVFELTPLVDEVAEDSGETIQVEVSTGDGPFSLHHAVLVEGPFQLPEGYRLASDVIYLYTDPLEPVRPFILRLPHWYSQEEGAEAGITKRDDLVFVTAPHTPSQEGEEEQYKFVLQQEGNFPMSGVGLLQVNSHSTLFGIAFKEKITSKLRYCATHLEREEPSGQKVDIAVTFASSTWQKILRQHRKQSAVKSKPVEFNFQSSQIVGKVQRVTGKKWKASLEGSAQIHKEEINYRFHSIRSAKDLESAVKMGMYPPTLSFAVVYDTALKYSWHGRPSMVKLFCEGTTGGRLQFNSVVYEEKEGSEGGARGPGSLSLQVPAPSMILLQDYIPQLSDKWAELGTALGLEHQVLALRESTQSPSTRANSLLSAWITAGDKVVSGVKVEVSWAFLVRVLCSPAVDKGSIASDIQAKYEI